MGYELKITFGGLCMFVQKENGSDGLYVLMPRTSGHMEHCRMMITAPDAAGGRGLLVPLTNNENLSGLPGNGAKAPMNEDNVLQMSRYAHLGVNKDCFGNNPPRCLAWRIVLPLRSTMTPSKELGELSVPLETDPTDLTKYEKRKVTGMMEVALTVTEGASLQIAGKTLVPIDGVIELALLNIPRAELEGVRLGAKPEDEVHHASAYYTLLGDNCTSGNSGPIIKHAEKHEPAAGNPSGKRCPTEDEEAPDFPFNLLRTGVDPNNCTIGSGCPSYPC